VAINKTYRPFLYRFRDIDKYIEGVIEEKKAERRKKPRISEELKEKVRDLLRRGFSHRKITKRTGVSKSTVSRISKVGS